MSEHNNHPHVKLDKSLSLIRLGLFFQIGAGVFASIIMPAFFSAATAEAACVALIGLMVLGGFVCLVGAAFMAPTHAAAHETAAPAAQVVEDELPEELMGLEIREAAFAQA